ncbi:MAG: chemotaxis response regulator protein-glutamate methylesterase [Bryobacteraceae bacterium]|nr:chemotaxis response regulator protein-glutamate methylesterase [Bryobacteraceae bacterium]
MSTRVLVVDDSVLFRRAVSDALSGIAGVEVAGTASNGKLGLARLEELSPDLMTLDIEMPEMNGLEVLRAMQIAGSKTGVVVLSAQTAEGSSLTVRALELGAFDFVAKPDAGSSEANLRQLRARLQPILRAYERGRATSPPLKVPESALAKAWRTRAPIVLIGVSTGGPAALAELLPALPASLPAPIFIVQHMPALFTEALARSLDAKCSLRVKEAADQELAEPGSVYLAPGGRHMKLQPGVTGGILIRLTDEPPENNCRPSVDYLFRSAALHFPGRAIAAVLTGMGNDGAQGLRLLKRGGSATLAQDQATCIVYGMPREAALTGAVDSVLPLNQIAPAIVRAIAEARA